MGHDLPLIVDYTALESPPHDHHPTQETMDLCSCSPLTVVDQLPTQEKKETWSAFFALRKVLNEKWEKIETPIQKQSRIQREENAAANRRPPGKKGATVYIWKEEGDSRVRRPAGRGNYESIWEQYGQKQRRYDSFHNKWDVCTDFGDDPDSEDEEDADFYGDDYVPEPADDSDAYADHVSKLVGDSNAGASNAHNKERQEDNGDGLLPSDGDEVLHIRTLEPSTLEECHTSAADLERTLAAKMPSDHLFSGLFLEVRKCTLLSVWHVGDFPACSTTCQASMGNL